MKRHSIKNRFFRLAGSALCLLALLATLGGHWLVLQSVAWACMIHDFSKQESLRSAIVKTFDGQHPCRLCLSVQAGRQQEQSEEQKLPSTSRERPFEFLCDARRAGVPLPPITAAESVPTVPRCHTDFIESPPTPPPRAA